MGAFPFHPLDRINTAWSYIYPLILSDMCLNSAWVGMEFEGYNVMDISDLLYRRSNGHLSQSVTVISWNGFLRVTRLDDDSEWHDWHDCEIDLKKKRENDSQKHSKDAAELNKLQNSVDSVSDSTTSNTILWKGKRAGGRIIRQNSATVGYKHSLPGIVENADSQTVQQVPYKSGSICLDSTLVGDVVPLGKKSMSMSDLRNTTLSGSKIVSKFTSTKSQENLALDREHSPRQEALKDGLYQRVTNVKRMLRFNALMNAE